MANLRSKIQHNSQMKRIILLFCTVLSLSTPLYVSAWNLSDALKGLGGGDKSSAASGLASALGNILSTDKLTIESLIGTWHYSAPAVTFKSDNLLQKAGGAAASAVVVEKLTPIYQRTGFDKAILTVNTDSTFTLSANKLTLKGTIATLNPSASSQANFQFHFTIGGKIPVGNIEAYITRSATTGSMSVMFDVSKLITILETAGKFTSNSTINSAVKLLKSYDGLCAGFEMKKS